jgi:cyclase
MLRKRLIFTLIYNDGYFAQSRNFRLQRVGDIHWLQQNYQFQKIAFSLDELIILNASRQCKSIKEFANIVSILRQNVFIPIAAGGGIRTMEDAEILFCHGADKIVLNSVLHTDTMLVKNLVDQYGAQSIIASVDYKSIENTTEVFIDNGTLKISHSLDACIQHIESLNIGEIYLNSIDRDGTGFGYDIKTIQCIKRKIQMPLIIAGGAGNEQHLISGLEIEDVNAAATANLFNFIGDGLPNARKKIIESKINVACWRSNLN